jgi:phage tail sheath protein FI
MPDYLTPGVYVEEISIGAKPIQGIETSTVGFLGETERGPTTPKFITSWPEYQRLFGGYFGTEKYLPYAVEGFFKNGGQRCYIARITKVATKKAQLTLLTENSTQALKIEATGEGSWGKRIAIKTKKNPDGLTFKLSIFYWKNAFSLYDPELNKQEDINKPKPNTTEVFDNISMNKTSPNFYEMSVNNKSNLIQILNPNNNIDLPKDSEITLLSGETGDESPPGMDDYIRADTANQTQKKGLTSFQAIDNISIIYAPNTLEVRGLYEEIVNHCEKLKDRFAIIDTKKGTTNPTKPGETKYAAFYYPWINIIDPQTATKILIPPGGHIAGIYTRTDIERGVHKAPTNEIVKGAVSPEFEINKNQQDLLNPQGINCIRTFIGRGILVWGARTLSSDSLWKYINIRRLIIYLEKSIEKGTQWAVFEPDNEKLWIKVKQIIIQFLTTTWKDGAILGTTPEQAFFVRCDRTTMTQNDIDNGRLIVLIGVAPIKPAEFIIFRIAQWAGGSTTTE